MEFYELMVYINAGPALSHNFFSRRGGDELWQSLGVGAASPPRVPPPPPPSHHCPHMMSAQLLPTPSGSRAHSHVDHPVECLAVIGHPRTILPPFPLRLLHQPSKHSTPLPSLAAHG